MSTVSRFLHKERGLSSVTVMRIITGISLVLLLSTLSMVFAPDAMILEAARLISGLIMLIALGLVISWAGLIGLFLRDNSHQGRIERRAAYVAVAVGLLAAVVHLSDIAPVV